MYIYILEYTTIFNYSKLKIYPALSVAAQRIFYFKVGSVIDNCCLSSELLVHADGFGPSDRGWRRTRGLVVTIAKQRAFVAGLAKILAQFVGQIDVRLGVDILR